MTLENTDRAKDEYQKLKNSMIPTNGSIVPSSEDPLSHLPEDQQNILDRVDPTMISSIAKGPSSLVDQAVIGMMQNTSQAQWPRLRELLLSPGAAFKTLSAMQTEKSLHAKRREMVANAAMQMTQLAEQDLQVKIFGVFMNNLRGLYGDSIQNFCDEHGLSTPPEDSVAEQVLLIRIHSTQLGLAKYKETIAAQWEKYAGQRAELEGQIAISNQKEVMLPQVIKTERSSQALERARLFQKIGDKAGRLFGGAGAVVGSAVTSTFAGLFFGGEAGIQAMMKRFGKDRGTETRDIFTDNS